MLEPDGSLILEDGENEDRRCALQALHEQGIADDGSHKSGVTGLPNLYVPRIHLTNLRLVLLGEQRAAGRPPLIWGANLRHEWISDVGVVRRTYPPKKGLFKTKPRAFSDFAYVRVRLPAATTIEFRLLLEPGQSTEGLVDALVAQITGQAGRTAQPKTTAARDHDSNKYAAYNDAYTTTVIAGAVPLSPAARPVTLRAATHLGRRRVFVDAACSSATSLAVSSTATSYRGYSSTRASSRRRLRTASRALARPCEGADGR